MSPRLTPARAALLRLAASRLTEVERQRNGALDASYYRDGALLDGHEARAIEWLETHGYVRCTGPAGLFGLTTGPIRPTAQGHAWLDRTTKGTP